jgi:hypothetical protein
MPIHGSAFPTLTAIHEAAHFVTICIISPTAVVAAEIKSGQDDAGNQWRGTCYYHPSDFTPDQLHWINVAGACAVAAAVTRAGITPTAGWFHAQVSASDWELMNEDPAYPSPGFFEAVEAVCMLFTDSEIWGELIAVAEVLDDRGYVLNDAALALARSLPPEGTTVH